MTVVVDSSIAAKWVLPEEDSDRAVRLRDAENDFIAPTLIVAEIGNAIWKRVTWRDMARDEAGHALEIALSLLSRLLPSEQLARSALQLAVELQHPIYDCFYIALAQSERVPLVTADKRLLALRKKLKGVEIRGL